MGDDWKLKIYCTTKQVTGIGTQIAYTSNNMNS